MNKSSDQTNGRAGGGSPDSVPSVLQLDPGMHPARWEALVESIMERARPILEARRQQTLEGTLSRWRRPVMAGAAGLAAAAVAVLLLLPGQNSGPDEISFAEVMMPWSVAAWMDGGYAPTAGELALAVEEYVP